MKECYYGKEAEDWTEAKGKIVEQMLSPAIALNVSETGDTMQDVLSSSIRTGKTDYVQRYGRYHALTLVRWLAEVFSQLASEACYAHKIEEFFGVWEYFRTYRIDDSFLKNRKSLAPKVTPKKALMAALRRPFPVVTWPRRRPTGEPIRPCTRHFCARKSLSEATRLLFDAAQWAMLLRGGG